MSTQEETPEVPVAAVAAEVVSDTDGTVELESDSPVLMVCTVFVFVHTPNQRIRDRVHKLHDSGWLV